MTKHGNPKIVRSFRFPRHILDILETVTALRTHPDRPVTVTDVMEDLIETLAGEAKWAEKLAELDNDES